MVVALLVCLFLVLDSKWFRGLFNDFVKGIKDDFYFSIAVILVVYPICICCMIPVSQFDVILGFTFSEVYDDATKGFMYTLPITFLGSYMGALLSFVIARYCLRNSIK